MGEARSDDDGDSSTGSLLRAMVETPGQGALPIALGSVIDEQYRIVRALGRGGMGVVYLARDQRLERDVAIKLGTVVSPTALRRAEREALALARLSHPNVVVIHQVGEVGGRLYIAMEYTAGGNAREWLTAAPGGRDWREIVALYVAAGRGLVAAHAAGFVHRDFKPDNVLVGADGRPRVADFGLARDVGSSGGSGGDDVDTVPESSGSPTPPPLDEPRAPTKVTVTGTAVGTPAYMAPEQLAGLDVDGAADQFAFCVALWEALHGARPFRAAGRGRALLEAFRAEIEAGRIHAGARRDVPRRLDAILRRGLAFDPARRWPSMAALIAALEGRLAARARRRAVIAGGAVAAAAAAAVVIAWRPWAARVADGPSLRVVAAREVGRGGADDRAVLVRGDRIARTAGTAIAIAGLDGGAPTRVASPDGRPIVDVRPSRVDGWLIATTRLDGVCTTWQVPEHAGAAQVLDDGDCGARVELAPDSKLVAIARPGRLSVRELAAPRGALRWARPLDDADPGAPAWSPDGARIAIASGRDTVVLDAGSGAELARAPGRDGAAWFDADQLLHVRREGFGRSEVRVLARGADFHLHGADGEFGEATVDAGGLLVERDDATSRAYAVSIPSSVTDAIDLDADGADALDTGAAADLVVAGWTDDGQVITVATRGDQALVIRTPRGGHGTVLAAHTGAPGGGVVTTGRVLADLRLNSGTCERHAIDLAGGGDRELRKVSCTEEVFLSCARDALRCLAIDGKGAVWFDPIANKLGAAAPADPAPALSPDGAELASIAGARLVVRTIAGGAETAIAPAPPLPAGARLHLLGWGPGGRALLIAVDDPATGEHALVSIDRDGRWRRLVRSATRAISSAQISRDGESIALIAQLHTHAWLYFPIHTTP